MSDLSENEAKILDSLVSNESKKAKFRWDENFQRRILGLMLTDSFFLIQAKTLIQPEYFTNEAHVVVCQTIYDYHETYKNMPQDFVVKQLVLEKIREKPEPVIIYFKNEIENLYEAFVPSASSREILLDKLLTFAKTQSLRIAMDLSQRDLKKDPESEEIWTKIYERFRDAMNVNKSFEMGFQYFKNFKDLFDALSEDCTEQDKFTSGFSKIDECLSGGGCKRGEIFAWIGMPGKGKSLSLVKAAVENVKRGKKCLYLSVEMDWVSISKRFTSQFTMLPHGSLLQHKKEIVELIQLGASAFEDKNRFIVKQFPSGQVDVNDIRAYLNQLELYGFKPDLLIVDYPGEMKDAPGIPQWESKYRIMRDLRGLAIQNQMCVFTAMQPNKNAASLGEAEFIDEGTIGGSFDQFKPLDGLWSINQTNDETGAGFGRIFVVKHRNGKSRYSFTVEYDKVTLDIKECSEGIYRIGMHNYIEARSSEIGLDGGVQNKQVQNDKQEMEIDYAE